MAGFSMASMTDIVFLLLIFFMVTSTFVFPTALDVNLPQSNEQTSTPPDLCVILTNDGQMLTSVNHGTPAELTSEGLLPWLMQQKEGVEEGKAVVALYADVNVPYGKIVEVLNAGKNAQVKVVLATKPVDGAPLPEVNGDTPAGDTNSTGTDGAGADGADMAGDAPASEL